MPGTDVSHGGQPHSHCHCHWHNHSQGSNAVNLVSFFFGGGGWTTACVCSQPPCRRAGQKSGVATAVKGSGLLTLETGHSRSPPPPQWAPQTDEPRAATATPAKEHPYAVPQDSSDEGDRGRSAGAAPGNDCSEGNRGRRRRGTPTQSPQGTTDPGQPSP